MRRCSSFSISASWASMSFSRRFPSSRDSSLRLFRCLNRSLLEMRKPNANSASPRKAASWRARVSTPSEARWLSWSSFQSYTSLASDHAASASAHSPSKSWSAQASASGMKRHQIEEQFTKVDPWQKTFTRMPASLPEPQSAAEADVGRQPSGRAQTGDCATRRPKRQGAIGPSNCSNLAFALHVAKCGMMLPTSSTRRPNLRKARLSKPLRRIAWLSSWDMTSWPRPAQAHSAPNCANSLPIASNHGTREGPPAQSSTAPPRAARPWARSNHCSMRPWTPASCQRWRSITMTVRDAAHALGSRRSLKPALRKASKFMRSDQRAAQGRTAAHGCPLRSMV
mmetsp:Transcript_70006/g.197585  ORF Transcript_70006/g.197585 Transcript_70006/m.197585 type:complete len:340 (-) Transcript_70006:253-1272(-)